ncbi:MAG: histidine phosphatase family protein [Spirochaetales bacterium]|nr:histidine phosphatase family protein [Spirochaetales bacterium]
MKQLILVRHAKAMKRKEGLPDFVRSLVKKGVEQAKKISKKCRKRIALPELFISSPANRALETAHYFAREYGYPRKKIILKDELYNPLSEQEFFTLVKELNDNLHSVIIFGHDPAISNFVKFLAKNFQEEMPTCAVAVIEFKKESWKEIARGQGEILFYEYPKRLAKYYAQVSAGIESDIYDQLIRVFKKTDEKVTLANEQSIRIWAKGTAEKFTALVREFKRKEDKAARKREEQKKGLLTTIEEKIPPIIKEQEKPGQ